MDKAIADITEDGNLMLDDDFMMNILEPMMKEIKSFKEYLTYMLEEQQRCPVVSQAEEEKVYPYELLCAELYSPKQKDIIQSN